MSEAKQAPQNLEQLSESESGANAWESTSDVEFNPDKAQALKAAAEEAVPTGWAKMTGYYKKHPDKLGDIIAADPEHDVTYYQENPNEIHKLVANHIAIQNQSEQAPVESPAEESITQEESIEESPAGESPAAESSRADSLFNTKVIRGAVNYDDSIKGANTKAPLRKDAIAKLKAEQGIPADEDGQFLADANGDLQFMSSKDYLIYSYYDKEAVSTNVLAMPRENVIEAIRDSINPAKKTDFSANLLAAKAARDEQFCEQLTDLAVNYQPPKDVDQQVEQQLRDNIARSQKDFDRWNAQVVRAEESYKNLRRGLIRRWLNRHEIANEKRRIEEFGARAEVSKTTVESATERLATFKNLAAGRAESTDATLDDFREDWISRRFPWMGELRQAAKAQAAASEQDKVVDFNVPDQEANPEQAAA